MATGEKKKSSLFWLWFLWLVQFPEIRQNCCHQMSYFKCKIHQIRFRLGLRPRPRYGSLQRFLKLEVCMGMGKTGIPWVPWDSRWNGSKISHGMGMGIKYMGMGVKTWEFHQQLWIVFCSYIVTLSKGSNAGGATARDWASCAELK